MSNPKKQTYLWNGLGHLSKALASLKKMSEQLHVADCIKKFKDSQNRSAAKDLLVEAAIATPTSATADVSAAANDGLDDFVSTSKLPQTVLAQKVLMIYLCEAPNFLSVKMCSEILSVS